MRGRVSVGVILLFAVLLAVTSLGLSSSPSARLDQIGPPTDTPTGAPPSMTNTPVATATPVGPVPPLPTSPGSPVNTPGIGGGGKPRGEPATPSLGIAVNQCARVAHPDGLNLGAAPGFAAAHIRMVGQDDIVFVKEGPARADSIWWWKVAARDGMQGWGDNDRMRPYAGACFGLSVSTATPEGSRAAARPASSLNGSPTPTPVGQSELPATGMDGAALIFAGALAVVVLIAGLVRRRTQGTV